MSDSLVYVYLPVDIGIQECIMLWPSRTLDVVFDVVVDVMEMSDSPFLSPPVIPPTG